MFEKWKSALAKLFSMRSIDRYIAQKQPEDSKKRLHKSKTLSLGIATQFKNVDENSQHRQLVIGLDFGTAFTKVVVGEERLKIAIPLCKNQNGAGTDKYLLPTILWVRPDGEYSIDTTSDDQRADLKMSFIKGDLSETNLRNATAYLALVLRRIRAFIFDTKSELYSKNFIDWVINIGLPTESYHDNKLTHAYKKVLNAAWRISSSSKMITDTQITEALRITEDTDATSSTSSNNLHPEAISVFPEFVAQIVGYVRSASRIPDLHLLVDIGAGTLDATVFNVHEKNGDDSYPIFAKAVKNLGTRFLIQHRTQNKPYLLEEKLTPFDPVPDKYRFAELLRIRPSELSGVDEPFLSQIRETVGHLLWHTKRKRYPKSSKWQDGVPIFLCGGGANCDFYAEFFHPKKEKLAELPVKAMNLPTPDQLEAPEADYNRISVAYGLSFEPFDIGAIVKENDVEDFEANPPDKSKSSSNDVTCRRCQGTGGLHRTCDACGGSGFRRYRG